MLGQDVFVNVQLIAGTALSFMPSVQIGTHAQRLVVRGSPIGAAKT